MKLCMLLNNIIGCSLGVLHVHTKLSPNFALANEILTYTSKALASGSFGTSKLWNLPHECPFFAIDNELQLFI